MNQFHPDDRVLVAAPDFFKGHRLGVVTGPCRDHDDAYRVYVLDKEISTRDICVNPLKGDFIVSAEKTE